MNIQDIQQLPSLAQALNTQAYYDFHMNQNEKSYNELKIVYGSQKIQMLYVPEESLLQLYNKLRMMFDINPQYEIFLQEIENSTLVSVAADINTSRNYYLWIRDIDANNKNRKNLSDKSILDFQLYEEDSKDDQLSKDEHSTIMYCPFFECKKPFRHSGNLKTHIRSHTNERPFQCQFPLCGLSFITKGHLKTHMINHSNEKPFKCHICKISYSQKSRLEIHLRKHFGIKPFQCEICGNHFTEKGNLNVHMKSHKGKRDYECEICSQKFITKGHLEDHFRRHKKDRKFKCEPCGSEFYRSTQLRNHQLNQLRCMKNKQLKDYEDNYFSSLRNDFPALQSMHDIFNCDDNSAILNQQHQQIQQQQFGNQFQQPQVTLPSLIQVQSNCQSSNSLLSYMPPTQGTHALTQCSNVQQAINSHATQSQLCNNQQNNQQEMCQVIQQNQLTYFQSGVQKQNLQIFPQMHQNQSQAPLQNTKTPQSRQNTK
eukprot:403365818